ncbi:hypothetical protein [Bdellovibrio sp. HCB-110]|uniref:hypothetical protein n=1 Tax=Bdellovibrio sp. HCB-110 TaxID=3391182 RepID=UPI0039B4B22F
MILFDTNIINDLDSNRELRTNVVDFVKRHRGVFCISLLSIAEILDGQRDDLVMARLKRLDEIWELVGSSGFHVFIGSRELIPIEARSQGDKHFLHKLPQEYLDEIRKLFKGEIRKADFTTPVAEMMRREREDKVEFYRVDREFRKRITSNEDIDHAEIEDAVLNFRGLTNYLEDYKVPAAVFAEIYPSLTEWRLRQIQKKHRGYRLIKVLMSMLVFRNLCNAISESNTNPALAEVKRISRGQWYDIAIAATAAYADYFVTNDRGLVAFCEFLRKRNVLRFKTLLASDIRN